VGRSILLRIDYEKLVPDAKSGRKKKGAPNQKKWGGGGRGEQMDVKKLRKNHG